MEPAKSIVAMLGGPTAVATYLTDKTDRHLTTGAVARWYMPAPTGCAGIIPSRHIPALCKMAKKAKKFLEPNMFFRGHL